MEDRGIIELYLQRNENAISETERKYGRLCKKISKKILGNEHDAEECVNDTYLGIWNSIPPQIPNNLCAFIARIARNLSLTRLKYLTADKRTSEATLSLDELEEIIPDNASFEQTEDSDVGQWISDFLYSEDEEVRNIFVRKYWYFDSIAELAEKYGYSEPKIKSMLFRERNKLREYLKRKGVTL